GITYEALDRILLGLEGGNLAGLDKGMVRKVKETMAASAHKRQTPAVFRVSNR
ncbi:MAG: NAD(+) synthetase, partial [candidate division NC10 bacterium]|nr:NAD(+) synthetase [candidate division NC10 bacterium]